MPCKAIMGCRRKGKGIGEVPEAQFIGMEFQREKASSSVLAEVWSYLNKKEKKKKEKKRKTTRKKKKRTVSQEHDCDCHQFAPGSMCVYQ